MAGFGYPRQMDQQAILAELKILLPRINPARNDWAAVGMETPIRSLGFDSLSVMDLAYDVSAHFHVEFDLLDAGRIETVGDVVDLIYRLKNA